MEILKNVGDNYLVCKTCGKEAYLIAKKLSLWKICVNCATQNKWRQIKLKRLNKNDREFIKSIKWHTVTDLASMLSCSLGYVRYMVNTAKIPYFKLDGKTIFADEDMGFIRSYVHLVKRRLKNEIENKKEEQTPISPSST